MDRATRDSLTPREAKERLRAAAERLELASWVRRHPYWALLASLVAGAATGGSPRLRSLAARILATVAVWSLEQGDDRGR